MPFVKNAGLIALSVCWVGGLAVGMWQVESYRSTPGPNALAPAGWPLESLVERNGGDHTLVMFVHPKCPCSRSSIGELNRLMTRFGERLDAHALFLTPTGTDASWAYTDLYRSADAIPGVKVELDVDGREALLFGAKTSGQVMVYDPAGNLVFEGGITSARGHFGDNAGRDRLERQLTSPVDGVERFRVFGCGLFSHEDSHGGESA